LLPRVAVDEVLDRRVELTLRSNRDQSAPSEALEAIAQQVVLAREAIGLPYEEPISDKVVNSTAPSATRCGPGSAAK